MGRVGPPVARAFGRTPLLGHLACYAGDGFAQVVPVGLLWDGGQCLKYRAR